MPTECDKCHWNNKPTLQDQNITLCDKGERVWVGLQGLLRLTNSRNINYDPCPHLESNQPLTRFQRILQNE